MAATRAGTGGRIAGTGGRDAEHRRPRPSDAAVLLASHREGRRLALAQAREGRARPGRMDRGWQVRAEARVNIAKPPSAYLKKFYYDCIVYTESALRFLIDTVGADRVVFVTDWPYDMALDWPVSWILAMESLTQAEKEAILWRNLERLLN